MPVPNTLQHGPVPSCMAGVPAAARPDPYPTGTQHGRPLPQQQPGLHHTHMHTCSTCNATVSVPLPPRGYPTCSTARAPASSPALTFSRARSCGRQKGWTYGHSGGILDRAVERAPCPVGRRPGHAAPAQAASTVGQRSWNEPTAPLYRTTCQGPRRPRCPSIPSSAESSAAHRACTQKSCCACVAGAAAPPAQHRRWAQLLYRLSARPAGRRRAS